MSRTYDLVCPETQRGVWIGQGWNGLEVFYSGHPDVMATLGRFLAAHIGKPLVVMDSEEVVVKFDDYREWESLDDAMEPPV